MYSVAHHIHGVRFQGANKQFGTIFNPANGLEIGKVPFATQEEVNNAVMAAQEAYLPWASTTPTFRGKLMFKYKELLEKSIPDLSKIITQEHGKSLDDAKNSIQRGIEVVDFACNAPYLLRGHYSENVGTLVDTHSIRQPLGVCVGITPFNFPAMIPLWMFPMALIAGNTFVLKPSEKDPSCSLFLADLFYEAGFPAGVLNVVQGNKETVTALITHPKVQAISFVGSTPVANYIFETGTAHHKRVQAFGGAKNHALVMPDANLEDAANAIVGAAFGSAGQRCMAISVAVAVTDAVGDTLLPLLQERIKKLTCGPGTEASTEMGPLHSPELLNRVQNAVASGVKEGAVLVIDGRGIKIPNHEKGFFMGPTLFDQVTPSMSIYKEEIFGPVLILVRASSYESALQLVNDNPYGNGTAIFTQSGETARDFSSRVQVGMVGINVPIPVPAGYYGFGGWKNSFFGDIPMHGDESLHFYTKLKTVTSRWPKVAGKTEFSIPVHK